MPILQTPKDLGLAIRSRRKELGWDQAKLASQIGVTRQWVIDIEKGKPRAELELAMRALRVLGMSLTVDARKAAAPLSGASGNDRQANVGTPDLDIDAIVERNRRSAPDYLREIETSNQLNKLAGLNTPSSASSALNRLAELANSKLPKTTADYLGEIQASNQLNKLAGLNAPSTASSALNRLAELANPKLPKTTADYLREIQASNQLNKLAGLNTPSSASSALNRLAELANSKLPKTTADYMREIEASNQLNKLVGPKPPGSKKP